MGPVYDVLFIFLFSPGYFLDLFNILTKNLIFLEYHPKHNAIFYVSSSQNIYERDLKT